MSWQSSGAKRVEDLSGEKVVSKAGGSGKQGLCTPVESKEKIAEVWFREMFETADALLFKAHLSPAFWCDAVSYSQYLFIRMPNHHTGLSTPYQMLTGKKAR